MQHQLTWTPGAQASGSPSLSSTARWTALVATWVVAVALLVALLLVIQGVGWEVGSVADVPPPAQGMPAPMPQPGPGPG